MSLPDQQKPVSSLDVRRTRVYLEIGHGAYQIGPKSISYQDIFIWCQRPTRLAETYPAELGIEVAFIRGINQRHYTPDTGTVAQKGRRPSSGSMRAVRTSMLPGAQKTFSSHPPGASKAENLKEGFTFVSLERFRVARHERDHVRVLRVQPVVQLPPTNPLLDPWYLELRFPNFQGRPLRLPPSTDLVDI